MLSFPVGVSEYTKSSGRIPNETSFPTYSFKNVDCSAVGAISKEPSSQTILPFLSRTFTVRKFIGGVPINPATNLLIGLL